MQPSSYFDKLFSILIVNFDSSIFSLKDLRISSAVCILRDVALISYASKLKHTSRGIHEEYRRGGGRGGGWIERIERISCTFLHTVAHDTYKIQTLYTVYYCILHVRRSRATIHHICTNTFALKRTITRT